MNPFPLNVNFNNTQDINTTDSVNPAQALADHFQQLIKLELQKVLLQLENANYTIRNLEAKLNKMRRARSRSLSPVRFRKDERRSRHDTSLDYQNNSQSQSAPLEMYRGTPLLGHAILDPNPLPQNEETLFTCLQNLHRRPGHPEDTANVGWDVDCTGHLCAPMNIVQLVQSKQPPPALLPVPDAEIPIERRSIPASIAELNKWITTSKIPGNWTTLDWIRDAVKILNNFQHLEAKSRHSTLSAVERNVLNAHHLRGQKFPLSHTPEMFGFLLMGKIPLGLPSGSGLITDLTCIWAFMLLTMEDDKHLEQKFRRMFVYLTSQPYWYSQIVECHNPTVVPTSHLARFTAADQVQNGQNSIVALTRFLARNGITIEAIDSMFRWAQQFCIDVQIVLSPPNTSFFLECYRESVIQMMFGGSPQSEFYRESVIQMMFGGSPQSASASSGYLSGVLISKWKLPANYKPPHVATTQDAGVDMTGFSVQSDTSESDLSTSMVTDEIAQAKPVEPMTQDNPNEL
ncbi:hypothetical protein K435DRAFT_851175 [Dendrothele bispora CBS 962.96]|uniref:Uncharacterized protein n=1 Tax=Dendrothele bispora (strain CBS 962.96) TaxID=1314807 RepID=A0A4S8MMQ4_DENBC|nr:hypothetical protein K435DRAFT_851175 [Dendrothele bispora CBS 962.96]